jgi:Fe-S-cluster containining protein
MTSQSDFVAQLKQQFYLDAAAMAENAFKTVGISKFRLYDASHSFYGYLDGFLTQFEAFVNQQNQKIDCKQGCASCCYQAVFMSPFEAIYLAENIQKHCSLETIEQITKRVKQKKEATAKMTAAEYLKYRHVCPLLDEENGSCTMHEYRPVACRIYLSEDVKSCLLQHENPEKDELFATLYDLPLQVGRAYCEGLNQYFANKNLKVQEMKFEDALFVALENKKAAEDWIAGKSVFETQYTDEDLALFEQFKNRPGLK